MRKFLSVLLSIVIVFNTAFSMVKADTVDDSTDVGESSNTTVETTTNLDHFDMENVDYSSPLISKENETISDNESDNVEYADTDIVRVSIVLKNPSTLEKYSTEDIASNKKAMSYRASLEKKQEKVVSKIEKTLGETLDVKWNLTLAANIISADVAYGDIKSIENLSDVKEVFIEQQYSVDDDTNTSLTTSDMIYSTYAWANGYTGAGQLVAIVDTGTNQDHISFSGEALEYSLTKDGKSLNDYDLLTKEDVEDVSDQLNAYKRMHETFDVESSYKSLKIPYSFNYVDNNYTTDHSSDNQGEHGSHVSGIAAANRYVKVNGEYVDAANTVYAVGVAPDAQIITMKVFGANGGAYDSDYMAAIEDAILLGADSCNLSLGSAAAGMTFSSLYQEIMDNLVANNTVVSMSAGNCYSFSSFANIENAGYLYYDDINFDTAGSPGSFTNTLGVASADNIGLTSTSLLFDGTIRSYYNETLSDSYPNKAITSIAGDYQYVYIDASGLADELKTVSESISLEGKIVIINRGESSFADKGNNVGAYSPAAIICANNVKGSIGMNLSDYNYSYPFVAITLSDANKIKESGNKTTVGNIDVYTGSVKVDDSITPGITTTREEANMSEFSSWGIPSSLIMKPEITAPGGNIYSVNGTTNDGYENMSGTSMAAPHVAGMAAILAQYIEENDLTTKTGMSQRAIINSLLMSTATPMFNSDNYYSILQQGSGLADVYAATKSLSVIKMASDATNSYQDGKVKVELGDDPNKTGTYSYSFDITNTSDQYLVYELSTDIFTQDLYYDTAVNYLYLSPETTKINATVTYEYTNTVTDHDVDKDGDTDADDAQAILDYITGVVDGSQLDLAKGEMDAVEGLTSYDAQLLLEWIQEYVSTGLLVLPNETKSVKVNIQLEDKDQLDYFYVNGLYVEGYTYLKCLSTSEDGELLDVEKSIPIIGFYGNWSDPSMYDTTVVEQYYKGESSYTGKTSNYMSIVYPTSEQTYVMLGNPYAVENTFPEERLAINSETQISNIRYTLIRNAGTVGTLAYKVNDDGSYSDLLYSTNVTNSQYGAYYYLNYRTWYNASPKIEKVYKTATELGLVEGDRFDVSTYAVPEYYAMDSKGQLDKEGLETLVKNATLGEGAKLGYTFTVDDTAPVIKSVIMNEDGSKLTVTVSDNRYIAYVALTDLSGLKVYASTIPEQSEPGQECAIEFDMTNINTNAVVVFAGDYAANEIYKAYRIAEGDVTITREGYFLTDHIELNNEYVIASTNTEGKTRVLTYTDDGTNSYYYDTTDSKVFINDHGTYIPTNKVSTGSTWIVKKSNANGFVFTNLLINKPLSGGSLGKPTRRATGLWKYEDNKLRLYYSKGDDHYMYYNSISRDFEMRDDVENVTPVYLYVYKTYEELVEFDKADFLEITPDEYTLFTDGINTVKLRANLSPKYLENKTLTWTSSNEKVATVDENGLVTGLSEGTAVITATSNQTPTINAKANITVKEPNPTNGSLNAEIMVDSSVQFVSINLSDMSTTVLGNGAVDDYPLVGGGRDSNYIYGVDSDRDTWAYNIADGYSYEYLYTMGSGYEPVDGANFPQITSYNKTYDFDLVGVTNTGLLAMYYIREGRISYFIMNSEPGIAICYAGYSQETDDWGYEITKNYYYLLTESGELYLQTVYVDIIASGDIILTGEYLKVANVKGFDYYSDPTAFSMVFGRSVVGSGASFDTVNAVFISDANTGAIYRVDIPTEDSVVQAKYIGSVNADYLGVLYDDVYDSADIVNGFASDLISSSSNVQQSTVETVELFEQTENVEETETVESNSSSVASSDEVANKIVSFLDKVANKSSVAFNEEVETEEQVTVEYSQDEDTKNGLVTVSYDPEEVEFLGVETVSEYYSVYDDENGTVTFAYAQTEAIEANSTIAQFFFSKPCEDSTLTFTTKEVNDSLNENDEVTLTEEGVGHIWKFVGFEWNEDYSEAKAKFVCTRNEKHTKLVDAEVTSEITKKPTYESEGEKTVKAHVVFEEKEYEETKTVSIAKLRPDTGDHSNIVLWTSVTTVSLLAVVVATLLKKKYAVK